MKQKQQVMHIHGGEPYMGYDHYIDRLNNGWFSFNNKKPTKWYKNLRSLIDENIYEVITPQMPNSDMAKYNEWKIWFERHIEFMKDGIVLIGHSLGGNFLAKYLAEDDFNVKISQLNLVAPSYGFTEDDFNIIDFPGKLLKKNIPEIHIYHSKDDTVVPISESQKYHEQIPGSHFHVFEDRWHFLGEEFPELFENIIKIQK